MNAGSKLSTLSFLNIHPYTNMFLYLKAIHIIFVVTWFSGMFYIVRLFIYNTEANQQNDITRNVLQQQFGIMQKRLWLGITWPSAIITALLGISLLMHYPIIPNWLWLKLCFLIGLYAYHFSLHRIYRQQQKGIYKFSSTQLRLYNEVATIFLVAIVLLVVVRTQLSVLWGFIGLLLLVLVITTTTFIYKRFRR